MDRQGDNLPARRKTISLLEKEPLELIDLPIPEPDSKEILLKVLTGGVCHSEIDGIKEAAVLGVSNQPLTREEVIL